MFSPEEGRLREHLIILYNHRKGGRSEVRFTIRSKTIRQEEKASSCHQGGLGWMLGKDFFTKMGPKHRKRLPEEVTEVTVPGGI